MGKETDVEQVRWWHYVGITLLMTLVAMVGTCKGGAAM
jgi:hypothetical protein